MKHLLITLILLLSACTHHVATLATVTPASLENYAGTPVSGEACAFSSKPSLDVALRDALGHAPNATHLNRAKIRYIEGFLNCYEVEGLAE